jgi:hypothetical protein
VCGLDPVLAGTDARSNRISELKQRLDFAERLLAWREAVDQLPGGAQQ